MRKIIGIAIGLSVIATLGIVAMPLLAASPNGNAVFTVGGFAGVSGVYVGSAHPLRGIDGGGFPWVIAQGKAEVSANGHLVVEVQGLVIDPSNATAQAKGVAGVNPLKYFFATVSCLSPDGTTVNVNTAAFPATSMGNATMQQMVSLPSSCMAPLVFVRGSVSGETTTPTGPWFAVSGF